MTVKMDSLAANLKAEADGEWIPVKEWSGLNPDRPLEVTPLPGVAFRVRSTNYDAYVVARQAALEKIKQDYPDEKVPQEVASRIEGELAARHLLLEWRGFDVPYSIEAANAIVTAEEHRNIRGMIYWCAGRVGRKQVEFVKDQGKNSVAPSGTK